MTTIVVTKNDAGKLEGVGAKAQTSLLKFERWVAKLEPGEVFTLEFWFPRNPRFHKLHFAMLGDFFDAQEQFEDPERLRIWLQVGAGFADFVPGPHGKPVAYPQSISYSKMDDDAFSDMHGRVKAFMRSLHCTRFLWPHLPDHEASTHVERILEGYEQRG